MLEVLVLSAKETYFEGPAESAIFPGELGVFEILPFHKPLLSRLINGIIMVDDFRLSIKRGIVKVRSNKVTAIVEKQEGRGLPAGQAGKREEGRD